MYSPGEPIWASTSNVAAVVLEVVEGMRFELLPSVNAPDSFGLPTPTTPKGPFWEFSSTGDVSGNPALRITHEEVVPATRKWCRWCRQPDPNTPIRG